MGAENGFDVEATSSSAVFNDTDLARFQAVVFNNTEATPGEGRLLEADERAALRSYIRAGGGWVGLHAAAGDGSDWDWYTGLTGAVLDRSTPVRTGRIDVLDHAHPSTSGLPDLWERTEEWYDWRADPASDVHTLARIKVRDGLTGLDEGRDHPWSWCQNYDGGRSWFTAGGHAARSFREEGFLDHLLGGIEWAAGAKPGDCSATRTGSFRRTALTTDGLADPVDLAVAPDLRVFFAERAGKVKVIDQRSMRVSTAIDFAYAPETVDRSGGLVGLTLDPGFARNGRLYVLRSEKAGKRLLLSRFTVSGNTAEPASEKRLLTVPVGTGKKGSEEEGSSPVSASLAFDAKGVLHTATPPAADLAVADDPNDLRGKILRIVPQDDGTYTVPEGNLHAPGTAGTRPEIYAAGLRHPYRIAADPRSGTLLVAEQGPEGTVGYLRITEAGVVGRPYCADGAAPRTGPVVDCAAPVGGPPRTTGAVTTAPVTDAPLSGSVYDHAASVSERTAFPAYFEGKWLSYDPVGRRFTTLSFTRADQAFADPRFDPVDAGALQSVDGVFEDMEWHRPTAARFGPDGSLYVVDHGLDGGTGRAGGNEGAGVHRIDYAGDGPLPEATITADRDNGSAPLTVAFGSAGSGLHGRPPVTYAWDFDGDGTIDSTAANPSHTYREEGRFTARLTVTGPGGATAIAGQEITVGNSRPEVTLRQQHDGGLFTFGDTLAFTVAVTDGDDGEPGPVDCSRVVVRSRLGTGTPLRPVARPPGCRGEIVTAAGDRHGRDPDLPYTLTARYTDGGAPALTGSASLTLRTTFREAEHFAATGGAHGGAVAAGRTNASGGRTLTEIEDGDWIAFEPVRLGNVDSVMVGAIACGIGGTIDFRAGSPTGRLLGTVSVAGTGSQGAIVSPTTALEDPGGGVKLYVVFTNPRWSSAKSDLFTVDWLHFRGPGNGRKSAARS